MLNLIPILSLAVNSFVGHLQNTLIPPSMVIKPYSYQVESTDFNLADLRAAISAEVRNICLQRPLFIQKDCYLSERYLASNAVVKKYWGTKAVTSFANWMAFDDNWFSQSAAFDATTDFISDKVIYTFVNFDPVPTLTDPVSPYGLPITVDYTNNEITIWTIELND